MELPLFQALILTAARQVVAHLEAVAPMDLLQQQLLLHLHMEVHPCRVAALFHLEVAAHMDLHQLQRPHHPHMAHPLCQALIRIVVHQLAAHLELAIHTDPLQQPSRPHLHMEVPLCQVAAPFHLEVAAHMDLHRPQPHHHRHMEAQVVDLHQHPSHHTEAPVGRLQLQAPIAGHHHLVHPVVALTVPLSQHRRQAQTLMVLHQAAVLIHMAVHLQAVAHLILIAAPLLQTMFPFITHKDTKLLKGR